MALELLVHLMWVTALINNHLKGILPMSPGVPSRLLKSVSQESIPIMYELPLIQMCYPLIFNLQILSHVYSSICFSAYESDSAVSLAYNISSSLACLESPHSGC